MDYLEQRRKLRQMVQERLDYGRDYTDEEVEDTIDEVLMEQESLELCPVELRRRLRKELFDSLRRLDILQIFVEDSSVTEIMNQRHGSHFCRTGWNNCGNWIEPLIPWKNYRMSFSRLWRGVIAWSMKRHPS